MSAKADRLAAPGGPRGSGSHHARIYAAALDRAPIAVWIYDTERIIYANAACARLVGVDSPEQIIGRTPFDFLDPAYHEVVRNRMQATIRGETVLPNIEELIRRPDGSAVEVEVNAWTVPFGSGQAIQVMLSDISARKRQERAMMDAEQHVRRVLDSLFVFVGVLTPEGILIEANRAPLEAAGISWADVIGKPFQDTFWWSYSPETQKQLTDAMARARQGESLRFDIDVRMKHGLMTIDFMLSPLRDANGNVVYLIPSAVDLTERKRAENAVRASEQMLRSFLENAPLPMGIVELESGSSDVFHIYDNAATARFFGTAPGSTNGRWAHAEMGAPTDTVHLWTEHYRKSQASGKPSRFVYQHESGSWLDVTVWCLGEGPSGRVQFCYQCEDVTSRKQAEAAITESERRFRGTFENAAVGIALVGADYKWLMLNERMCQILGYTREELLAVTFQEITHPEDIAADVTQAQELARGDRSSYRMEKRYLRKNGEVMWATLTASAVRDDEGNLLYFIAVVEDITEAKAAAEALEQSEREFQGLANSMPQLVWTAAPDGSILWYNQRWYDYTGLTVDETLGWNSRPVVHPDHRERVMEHYRKCISAGQPWEDTFPILGRDGEYRWFLTRALPFKREDGTIELWFGTNTDVTEQRATEEALRSANAELQQFAFVVSHDLQEPLRNVNIYSELLLRKFSASSDEETNKFAAYVQNGVKRMHELVRDLLGYSQVVHGADEAMEDTADLRQLTNDLLQLFSDQIEEKSAVISVGDLPVVRGNAKQLSQVLQNLISNALKYHQAGQPPFVRISAVDQGSSWLVSVEDRGLGFDPRYANRIFGLFKRLHGSDFPGTGLGLAISKRIIEQHHGRIWAESQPGQGTRFYIELPK